MAQGRIEGQGRVNGPMAEPGAKAPGAWTSIRAE